MAIFPRYNRFGVPDGSPLPVPSFSGSSLPEGFDSPQYANADFGAPDAGNDPDFNQGSVDAPGAPPQPPPPMPAPGKGLKAPPMAPGMVGVTPQDLAAPPPQSDEDFQGPTPPPGVNGPQPPRSQAQSVIDRFRSIQTPPPPAAPTSTAGKIGSGILDVLAAKAGVERHPNYARQLNVAAQQKQDALNEAQMVERAGNIQSLEEARHDNAAARLGNVDVKKAADADRHFKFSLDLANMGGKVVAADALPTPGAVRLQNPMDATGKTFVDVIPTKGATKVDDPELAKRLGVKPGADVSQTLYLKGLELQGALDLEKAKAADKPDKEPNANAILLGMRANGQKTGNSTVDAMTADAARKSLMDSKEKPITVNANQAESALDKEVKQYGAKHDKAYADANSQLDKINDAQMMVRGNAMDQALGVPKVMTALISGAGSGVRITQPELSAIANARGIGGDIEGTIRSWLGKGKLTPTQQAQLGQVLDDVKQRVIQKRQIAEDATRSMRNATSRKDILAAEDSAQKALTAMESGSAKPGSTVMGAGGVPIDLSKFHK